MGFEKWILKKINMLTVIVAIGLTLSACVMETPNVVRSREEMAAMAKEEDASDYFTIAYANMINLDSAVKLKNKNVLYGVSRIQTMYGALENALETINRSLEFSYDMSLIIQKEALLERLGKYDERNELVNSVVHSEKSNYLKMNLNDKLNYNYLLISYGENEEAIHNYLEILNDNIDRSYLATIYNNIGWAYLNLNDYDNAMDYTQKALEYDPEDSITLSNLGNCYYGLQDYKTAITYYENAMMIDPSNTYSLYGYASSLQALEEYDDAIGQWLQYVALSPLDIDGWDSLYACYQNTEDLNGQEKCLSRLTRLAPENKGYAFDYMVVKQSLGNYLDYDELTASIRATYDDFEADRMLGEFLYYYVSESQGIEFYSKLLSQNALSYQEYASLAEDLFYLGDEDLFTYALERVEQNLSRVERLEIEVYLYYYDESPERLMKAAKEIVTIDSKNGYGYEYLGDAYYFRGDYENAAQNYGLAVMYSEDSYYARQAQVDALIRLGDLKEADRLNRDFIDLYPEDAYGYVYQARIEMKLNAVDEAIENLLVAMSLSSSLDGIFESFEELAPIKEHPEFMRINP